MKTIHESLTLIPAHPEDLSCCITVSKSKPGEFAVHFCLNGNKENGRYFSNYGHAMKEFANRVQNRLACGYSIQPSQSA